MNWSCWERETISSENGGGLATMTTKATRQEIYSGYACVFWLKTLEMNHFSLIFLSFCSSIRVWNARTRNRPSPETAFRTCLAHSMFFFLSFWLTTSYLYFFNFAENQSCLNHDNRAFAAILVFLITDKKMCTFSWLVPFFYLIAVSLLFDPGYWCNIDI